MTIFRYLIEEDVGGLFSTLESLFLSIWKNIETLGVDLIVH
jgi:hypothetical protein